jgi:hypothetical protein
MSSPFRQAHEARQRLPALRHARRSALHPPEVRRRIEDRRELFRPPLKRVARLAERQRRHVCAEELGPGVAEHHVVDDPGRRANPIQQRVGDAPSDVVNLDVARQDCDLRCRRVRARDAHTRARTS